MALRRWIFFEDTPDPERLISVLSTIQPDANEILEIFVNN
jgi:hypothetical protein